MRYAMLSRCAMMRFDLQLFDMAAEGSSAVGMAWESVVDSESGDVYYYNATTGETTWELPLDTPSPAPLVVEPT